MTEEEVKALREGDVVRMKSSAELNDELLGAGETPNFSDDEFPEEELELIGVPEAEEITADWRNSMFQGRLTIPSLEMGDDGLREFSGDQIKSLVRKGDGTAEVGDTPFERYTAGRKEQKARATRHSDAMDAARKYIAAGYVDPNKSAPEYLKELVDAWEALFDNRPKTDTRTLN